MIEQRNAQVIASMAMLCQDPKFQIFMDEVQRMKDQAVRDLCNDTIVSDERLCLATIGEIRQSLSLLDAHQNFLENAQQIALDSQQE